MPARIQTDNEEIIRRYEAGESCVVIAEAFNISDRTVLNRLQEAGVPCGHVVLDTAEIVRRYKAGETTAQIGQSLGVSANTILNRLRDAGVAMRRGSRRKYNDDEVCRLYRDGMLVADIQEKTGVHNTATFYEILKRNNVPTRRPFRIRDCPITEGKIKKMNAQGLTQVAIAKQLGINRTYVGDVLRKEITVDRKRWQPEVTVTPQMSVKEMRDRDLTIDEIAEITGMSRVDVFQELTDNSHCEGNCKLVTNYENT